MNEVTISIGIGIVCFLILYFVFNLDQKEHILLKILGVFFVLGLILLIPKAYIDYKDDCYPVVNQSVISGGNITNTYTTFCESAKGNTNIIFYKSYLGFIIAFVTYIFIYINYIIWIRLILEKIIGVKK